MKKQNINFITLEGVDGVGKSTIYQYIKEKYRNIEFYHDPDIIDPIGKFILSTPKEILANLSLEVKALIYTASTIDRQSLIKSDIVFTDRSAISTYAYYYELGLDYLETIHKNYIFPQHIIYIYTDIDTIIQRLEIRDDKRINKKEFQTLLANYEIILDFFEKNKKIKITKINNTNIDETLLLVDNCLNTLQ